MKPLARLLALIVAARAARHGVTDGPAAPVGEDPSSRTAGAGRTAELLVAVLLVLTGVAGVAFAVLVALHASTQLLGLAAALVLAVLALGFAIASFRVVPQETAVEDRPPVTDAPARAALADTAREGGEGVSRRKLLGGAAGAAGVGLAAAAVAPLASLGPRPGGRLGVSPWAAGTALVRVRPDEVDLPADRRTWAPGGLLAYSKICTHAGCAVALFRYPLNEDTSRRPGLVCPCHYSTFDPTRAAKVDFGPAGRPLPQLPLRVRGDGTLEAAGPLSGPVGPSWWGVGHA